MTNTLLLLAAIVAIATPVGSVSWAVVKFFNRLDGKLDAVLASQVNFMAVVQRLLEGK